MISRFLKSLLKVSSNKFKCNFRYKINLFINSIKKGLKSFGFSTQFNIWNHPDCVIYIKFANFIYGFYCIKNTSFNLYMNPYFHEYDVSRFISRSLKKGDIFIDVGAMGGLYSIIASKLTGNEGKVFSIEPNPESVNILHKNLELNNLDNIFLYKNAIGEKNCKIKLYYNKESLELTSIFNYKQKNYFETDMVTLDSIIEENLEIKILKIDTEGYDEKVIEGAKNVLKKTKFIILEKNDESIRRKLKSLGFNYNTIRPSGYLIAFKD